MPCLSIGLNLQQPTKYHGPHEINNKMLSLMIHAGYEGRDHCRKNLHHQKNAFKCLNKYTGTSIHTYIHALHQHKISLNKLAIQIHAQDN